MRSSLVLLAAAALFASCGNEPAGNGEATGTPVRTGQQLYEQQCALCHGREGGLMMGGAKDLRVSTITREEAIAVVAQGRNNMMPYKNVMKPDEINAVVDHVLTLRTAK